VGGIDGHHESPVTAPGEFETGSSGDAGLAHSTLSRIQNNAHGIAARSAAAPWNQLSIKAGFRIRDSGFRGFTTERAETTEKNTSALLCELCDLCGE
jgi:hypothetical protein